MMTQPSIERRKQPRISLEEMARVHILASRDHPTGLLNTYTRDGYLLDLNNLGAFVATELDLNTGRPINIVIDLPGMRMPALLPAIVARRADRIQCHDRIIPEGLGLRFIAESNEDQERIRRIVMMILTLDLLKYGYENRRTIRFWRDVFADNPIGNNDWETHIDARADHLTNTQIVVPDSVGRDLFEAYSRDQVGLSSSTKLPE
jgi:hypothetical protein